MQYSNHFTIENSFAQHLRTTFPALFLNRLRADHEQVIGVPIQLAGDVLFDLIVGEIPVNPDAAHVLTPRERAVNFVREYTDFVLLQQATADLQEQGVIPDRLFAAVDKRVLDQYGQALVSGMGTTLARATATAELQIQDMPALNPDQIVAELNEAMTSVIALHNSAATRASDSHQASLVSSAVATSRLFTIASQLDGVLFSQANAPTIVVRQGYLIEQMRAACGARYPLTVSEAPGGVGTFRQIDAEEWALNLTYADVLWAWRQLRAIITRAYTAEVDTVLPANEQGALQMIAMLQVSDMPAFVDFADGIADPARGRELIAALLVDNLIRAYLTDTPSQMMGRLLGLRSRDNRRFEADQMTNVEVAYRIFGRVGDAIYDTAADLLALATAPDVVYAFGNGHGLPNPLEAAEDDAEGAPFSATIHAPYVYSIHPEVQRRVAVYTANQFRRAAAVSPVPVTHVRYPMHLLNVAERSSWLTTVSTGDSAHSAVVLTLPDALVHPDRERMYIDVAQGTQYSVYRTNLLAGALIDAPVEPTSVVLMSAAPAVQPVHFTTLRRPIAEDSVLAHNILSRVLSFPTYREQGFSRSIDQYFTQVHWEDVAQVARLIRLPFGMVENWLERNGWLAERVPLVIKQDAGLEIARLTFIPALIVVKDTQMFFEPFVGQPPLIVRVQSPVTLMNVTAIQAIRAVRNAPAGTTTPATPQTGDAGGAGTGGGTTTTPDAPGNDGAAGGGAAGAGTGEDPNTAA